MSWVSEMVCHGYQWKSACAKLARTALSSDDKLLRHGKAFMLGARSIHITITYPYQQLVMQKYLFVHPVIRSHTLSVHTFACSTLPDRQSRHRVGDIQLTP
mgnify:CR=1